MFGYITIDPNTLSTEDKTRYRSYYCGLCKRLGEVHGLSGRMTLTYDMTFVALLLSSVYSEKETVGLQRCMMHPLHSHEYICAPATDYAADLNMILAYYKRLDDWNDDKNVVALGGSQILRGKVEQAAARWPRQYAAIVNGIADLSGMEKYNEMNPDLPANCFGAIMGELFIRKEDENAATLRKMGAALGRFIYLLDAVNDLKADIKRKRYNPLVSLIDTDYTSMLTMLIGECTAAFEQLPVERNGLLLKNILYAGVWMKYKPKVRNESYGRSLSSAGR